MKEKRNEEGSWGLKNRAKQKKSKKKRMKHIVVVAFGKMRVATDGKNGTKFFRSYFKQKKFLR